MKYGQPGYITIPLSEGIVDRIVMGELYKTLQLLIEDYAEEEEMNIVAYKMVLDHCTTRSDLIELGKEYGPLRREFTWDK